MGTRPAGPTSPSADSVVMLAQQLRAAGWPPARHAKGDAGQVVVVGGSARYAGPPALAALAALRTGADDVRVIAPAHAPGLIGVHQHDGGDCELDAGVCGLALQHTVSELVGRGGSPGRVVVLIGPGLGGHPDPGPVLEALAAARARFDAPVVVDGHLGGGRVGAGRLAVLRPDLVLLSGREARALLGDPVPVRVGEAAAALGAAFIVKGHVDQVVSPGRCHIREPADGAAELTKSGTGDVMAGAVAALVAAGLDPFDAAAAGCWLMQAAGRLARARFGPGFLAAEVADQLSAALLAGEGQS
jgi:NAD(P)H-hydrate repair Nnr-like enzyme with NAD(P)H-hydrate dehydratase domain